jgi:hypothetical protein
MFTPAVAPSWRAHIPAQFTTYSASISPYAVRTPVTTPRRATNPVTGTPSMIVTPCMRAPLASDIVTSTGFAWPSSAT